MEAELKGYLSECLKMRNGEPLTKTQSIIWGDVLAGRNNQEILEAISLAMKTTTGRLTPDKVFSCFKSAHPSPEEAWNAIPKSENDAGVITDEMMQAMGSCQDSLDRNDMIGARMAFIESYKNITRGLTTKPKFFLTRSSHENQYTRQQRDNNALESSLAKGYLTQDYVNQKMIGRKGGDLKALEHQITKEQRDLNKKHINRIREILNK